MLKKRRTHLLAPLGPTIGIKTLETLRAETIVDLLDLICTWEPG